MGSRHLRMKNISQHHLSQLKAVFFKLVQGGTEGQSYLQRLRHMTLNASGGLFILIISCFVVLRLLERNYIMVGLDLIAIAVVFFALWLARRGAFNAGAWMIALAPVLLAFLTQFGMVNPLRRIPQLCICMVVCMLIFNRLRPRLVFVAFCLVLLTVSSLYLDGNWMKTAFFIAQMGAFAVIFAMYVNVFEAQDNDLNETIEALKKSNQERAKANEELNERVEELMVYSHIMSHDLKGPLFGIRGYSELLKLDLEEAGTKEDTIQHVDEIMASTDAMSTLVNALLTYSKISLADCEIETVELRPLLEEVAGLLRYPLQQSGGSIEFGHLHALMGNHDMFKTTFYNLLSNGLKYQPTDRPEHKPRLSVWSVSDAEMIVVYIRDNGVGIDSAYLPDLFTPFKRDREGGYEGTGLGMPICQSIVERFHGTIVVDETSVAGTTFKLTFPNPDKLGSTDQVATESLEPTPEPSRTYALP